MTAVTDAFAGALDRLVELAASPLAVIAWTLIACALATLLRGSIDRSAAADSAPAERAHAEEDVLVLDRPLPPKTLRDRL